MPKMKVLVGNIGSGKTTWILKNRKPEELVVSRDAFRYMFGGGEYLFDYENVEPVVKFVTNRMVTQLCELGKDIVLDETNVNIDMRQTYLDIAHMFGYETIAIEFPRLSKKVSVNRRMKNPHGQSDRKIWNEVWQKFDDMYEKPSKKEGFNKIVKVKA